MGTPISSLPVAGALTGAELVPIVQSGITKQTTMSAVPYTPAGTGAVATTVQNKLRETVSVFDFMTAAQIADAKSANPTLDLAPAFQACVNAAPASGCLIEIPPGVTITVGANIVWKSNLYLHIGAGSTIKRKDNSPDAYRVIDARGNLTNIGFYGPGKIDANAAGQPAGNKGHGLAITAKNAIVIGLEVCNVPMGAGGSMGDGIILEPDIFGGTGFQCENIYIQGGRIRNIARQGVTLESGLNVHVLGVKFDDIGAYAIDVENAGFTIGDVDGVFIDGLIVNRAQGIVSMVSAQPVNKQQNIVVSDCIGDTLQIAYTMRASKNITVQGGYLTNVSQYAVYLYTNGVTTASDITIRGITSKGTSIYSIYAQAVAGGRFSNIVIEDCDLENTVRCVSVDGLTYKNNKVKHNTSGLVASGCTGMGVLDNTVVYVGGGTNYREIDLSTITGLTIGRNRTTGGLVGLAVQACSNIKLYSDNDFSASATPFLDAGSNTNWTGQFTGNFTMGAANQINVPCKFWKSTSIVTLIPTNAAAALLQSGTKMLWIDPAASTENSQFRVKTADNVAAAGTETFKYVVTNS